MKYFQAINEIINLSHEAFHEYNFGKAYTHVFQFRRKRLHFREVMQLHRSRKVQQHMC